MSMYQVKHLGQLISFKQYNSPVRYVLLSSYRKETELRDFEDRVSVWLQKPSTERSSEEEVLILSLNILEGRKSTILTALCLLQEHKS